MKKICVVLLCAILCFSFLGLATGCDDKEEETEPTFATIEVGYKVDVYPSCQFDYSLQDNEKSYIIHIKSIEMTLVEKRTINENSVVTDIFYPYSFLVTASGETSQELVGRRLLIAIQIDGRVMHHVQSYVEENGNIVWSGACDTSTIPKDVFFARIIF